MLAHATLCSPDHECLHLSHCAIWTFSVAKRALRTLCKHDPEIGEAGKSEPNSFHLRGSVVWSESYSFHLQLFGLNPTVSICGVQLFGLNPTVSICGVQLFGLNPIVSIFSCLV